MSNAKPTIIENWNMGGLSDSPFMGSENSLAGMVGVSVHEEVGILKAGNILEKISGTTITELCKTSVDCSDGGVYFFSSESGKIWRWDGSAFTLVYTTSAPQGDSKCLDAIEYDGFLWWTVQNYIYRIPLTNLVGVTNWATFWSSNAELYSHMNWELSFGKDPHYNPNGGIGAIYTLLTSISEDDVNKMVFNPIDQTLIGVAVDIVTKGSGNIVVTIHDEANNVLATKTVALSGLAVGLNEIYFTTKVSYPSQYSSYHAHVTVDTTGTTLNCFTAEDFSTAYVELFVECDNEFHPMLVQNNTLYIGDRNYVHEIKYVDDDSNVGLSLSALDIPKELRIKCLGAFDTDVAVGTIGGWIFRWNTWSDSWSIEDILPEDSVNAFLKVDNAYYVQAGSHGALYFYSGDKGYYERALYGNYDGKTMSVNPNAVASFKGIPLFGVSNKSGNPLSQGVYSFGTRNSQIFPRILALEYLISTGHTSDVEIGCLVVSGGNILYVAWKDGTTYGVDKISTDRKNLSYIVTKYFYNKGELTDNLRKIFVNYTSIPIPETVTYSTSTDKFTLTSHDYNNNDIVRLYGTPPTGFAKGTDYYVVNADANTFQLSSTEGGTPIEATDAGTDVKVNLSKYVNLYYRKNYTDEWKPITLINDGARMRYNAEFIGEDYISVQIKLELLTRGDESPRISYLILSSE